MGEELIRKIYGTRLWIGPEYSYATTGEANQIEEITEITKILGKVNLQKLRPPLMIFETSHPACYVLSSLSIILRNTQYNNLHLTIEEKLADFDPSVLTDAKPVFAQMSHKDGLERYGVLVGKLSRWYVHYNEGVSLEEWFKDIKKEIQNRERFIRLIRKD